MSIKHALMIMTFFLLMGCSGKNVYVVKNYKYFNDDEVHISVVQENGHIEKYLCAFPPNTDYIHMKKIKILKVKTEHLLSQTVFYCQALYEF